MAEQMGITSTMREKRSLNDTTRYFLVLLVVVSGSWSPLKNTFCPKDPLGGRPMAPLPNCLLIKIFLYDKNMTKHRHLIGISDDERRKRAKEEVPQETEAGTSRPGHSQGVTPPGSQDSFDNGD